MQPFTQSHQSAWATQWLSGIPNPGVIAKLKGYAGTLSALAYTGVLAGLNLLTWVAGLGLLFQEDFDPI